MKRYFVAELIGHVLASRGHELVQIFLLACPSYDASCVAALPSDIPGIVAIYASDAWGSSREWAERIASASSALGKVDTRVLTHWPNDVAGWSRVAMDSGEVVHLSRQLAAMSGSTLSALSARGLA